MKINQVEELAGITKKNIRFYEEQGLLNPERNPENGYREYTLKDVDNLLKVKLLRKLNVPIEEIRQLNCGELSFSECMTRQEKRLKEEQESLTVVTELCAKLRSEITDINLMDATACLEELNRLEQGGATFMDLTKNDVSKRSITSACLAAGAIILLCTAVITGISVAAAHETVPLPALIWLIGAPAVTIILTITVLVQRIKEIRKGEAYDARNY